jgi:pimeloyl-ACP methyl ester carboxylesterase
MDMTALRVNGAELAYAEFGTGDTIVVSAQQEFAPGGFLEQHTGVSHGGVIGWHLAVEHPGLLKGLVAIVGVPPVRSRRDGVLSGRASQMASRSSPATLRANMEQLFGPTSDPARLARRELIIESRIQRILATPPEEAAVRLGIGFPDVDSDEELDAMLGQIHIPTLIIGGMYDPWVTPEALLRTTRAVPGSKLVVFQDESHLLSTESPAKIIDEFRLFVGNLAQQSCNITATRT